MKKSLMKKINKYCEATHYPYEIYFDENKPEFGYEKCKYFFKYFGTNIVAHGFKTQKELEEFLDNRLTIDIN